MSTRNLLLLACLTLTPCAASTTMAATPHTTQGDGANTDMLELDDTSQIDTNTLSGLDGKADTTIDALFNDNHQQAGINDNQLASGVTGINMLGAGVFSGSNGISTIIQNSGNQVLIQQTTQVNVLFRP